MRDYFVEPAQTNVELYAQAIAHGFQSERSRRLAQAYQFAIGQVFPLARGSGKPFICHLVGTASLVLESGCPDDWVTAALLHAMYQNRIPFRGGLALAGRRLLVTELFGPVVDDLITRYTEFEVVDLLAVPKGAVMANADVLTLRLADELEDLCGYALALHGRSDADEPAVRGSYPWRRGAKRKEADSLLANARILGLDGIASGLTRWLDFASVPEELADFRTGWLSSVDLKSPPRR